MVRCRGSAKEDIKFESCDSMLNDRHPKDRRFMYAPSFDCVSNHAEIRKSLAIHRFEPATTKSECRETTRFSLDIEAF